MKMELLNCSENLPTEFYIFVNTENLLTKHNLDTTGSICSAAFFQLVTNFDKEFANRHLKGAISSYSLQNSQMNDFLKKYENGSIDYLPFDINEKCDLNLLSMFNKGITSAYRTEFNCEKSRQFDFPTYPSRMSSCYAFGDFESCQNASNQYGWDLNNVRKFELIPHKHNRVAKVNMEIISLERYANNVGALDIKTIGTIWDSYWSGKGNITLELPTLNGSEELKSGLIWEYLIEGILRLKK